MLHLKNVSLPRQMRCKVYLDKERNYFVCYKNFSYKELPWWSSCWDSMHPIWVARFWSLVRELRYHMSQLKDVTTGTRHTLINKYKTFLNIYSKAEDGHVAGHEQWMAPSKLSILVTWGRERKKGEDFFVPVNLDLEPYSQEIEILTLVLLIIIKNRR